MNDSKKKVDSEFNKEWTMKYSVTSVGAKTVFKKFNINIFTPSMLTVPQT